jgi:hypothetical protein
MKAPRSPAVVLLGSGRTATITGTDITVDGGFRYRLSVTRPRVFPGRRDRVVGGNLLLAAHFHCIRWDTRCGSARMLISLP